MSQNSIESLRELSKGSGWAIKNGRVGLHVKETLSGELFISSRIG